MPPTSIVFGHSKPYDPVDGRPYAEVCFVNAASGVKGTVLRCLVDSGADYSLLPQRAYTSVGLTLSGVSRSYRTPAGSTSLPFESGVTLDVQGCRIKADVLLQPWPSAGFIPLLGRPELLALTEIGFNVTDWL